MNKHFVQLGADGAPVAADALTFVAIEDMRNGLIRAFKPFADKRFTFTEAQEACAALTPLPGCTPFRSATIEELFAMGDRSRFEPAVNPDEYPDIENDWYWSSTVDAESPSVNAWDVDFDYGGAGRYSQYGRGRVVAVCSRVSSQ
ncbi:MAG: DUF1566 domain-containing protein [Rhodanobacter sp.]